MSRPTLETFKKKALKKPGVRENYEELAPAYELRRKLVALRRDAGLTQEQIAEKLHTKKSNISRLESVTSKISPKLSTIADYAEAVGYDVKIDFVPKAPEHNKGAHHAAQKHNLSGRLPALSPRTAADPDRIANMASKPWVCVQRC